MEQITWNDSLSMGIPEIDDEHKLFIDQSDILDDLIKSNAGIVKILATLQIIIEMAQAHFKNEEELLRKWNYPGVDEHSVIHDNMYQVLEKYKKKMIECLDNEEILKIGFTIKELLIKHILNEDRVYAYWYEWKQSLESIDKIIKLDI